ncbi:hypothetical protein V6V47_30295 [Micromonospora sp. CPCC 205539]|uniref:hypothetical protein n=1 Tax=Micromonospora sp. CPCC 205539 TaxID=3122408 RepID=UPI002FEE7C73
MVMILSFIVATVAGNRWRWWLTVGGAALVLLPLGQGAPVVAVVAAICGPIVVGAWAWGTASGRLVGVAVGVVFIAGQVASFALSQRPTSLVAAPWLDWFLVWLLVGVVCLAALGFERRAHPFSPTRVAGGNPAVGKRRWVVSMSTLAAVVLLCGCGLGIVGYDGDGRLRFPARDDEVLPMPMSLRLTSADSCADGGSSGNCTAEFVVMAADSVDRATTVARLVEHLRSRGWPLQAEEGAYRGSRETAGILDWTAHRMWLYADVEPASQLRPAPPADAVVVHIDNL